MKKKKVIVSMLLAAVLIPYMAHGTRSEAATKFKPVIITGNGKTIAADGEKGTACLGSPSGVTMGEDGTLYITDTSNNLIHSLNQGELKTYAGKMRALDAYGEAYGSYVDAEDAKEAYFNRPYGITAFEKGFAVTDRENNAVRYISEDGVYTIAGDTDGKAGYRDGTREKAAFNNPAGITSDGEGNLYIADTLNHVIRKCTLDGVVTTYAGGTDGYKDGTRKTARFHEPMGVFYANGGLYVADTGNQRIRLIKGNKVTTVAGAATNKTDKKTYEEGYKDGTVTKALFASPMGISVTPAGSILVADSGNGRIRKIRSGKVTTIAGPAKDKETYPVAPTGLFYKDKKLYITDSFANLVYYIKLK